jgi:hypothetical protein
VIRVFRGPKRLGSADSAPFRVFGVFRGHLIDLFRISALPRFRDYGLKIDYSLVATRYSLLRPNT